jgi:hypothetical protein
MACRVCTANDRDALVEDLAAEFWKGSCADRSMALEGGRGLLACGVPQARG